MNKPAVAVACSLYLALFGAALFAWIAWPELGVAPLPWGVALVCAAPVGLCAWWLARHRGAVDQYIAKAGACAVMLPILLLMWGAEQAKDTRARAAELGAGRAAEPAPIWPGTVGFTAAHLVGAIGLFLAAASGTTRVPPAPGAAAVGEELLRARLLSLGETGLSCRAAPGDRPAELVVDYVFAPGERRAHRIALELDAAHRVAFVRERAGAMGAAPRDAAEADMRPLGQVGIDPTRPRAQRIAARTWMVSIIDPARLAATPLAFDGARAVVPEDFARSVDDRSLAYVVAALVTRSGWTFRPILFDFQRRA